MTKFEKGENVEIVRETKWFDKGATTKVYTDNGGQNVRVSFGAASVAIPRECIKSLKKETKTTAK